MATTSIFSGDAELQEYFRHVGLAIANQSAIERSLHYLLHGMRAFTASTEGASAAEVAEMVEEARTTDPWKMGTVRQLLRDVSIQHDGATVKARLAEAGIDAGLWPGLELRITDVARRRNTLAHAEAGIRPDKTIVLNKGPFFGDHQQEVTLPEMAQLVRDLRQVRIDFGGYVSAVQDALPFPGNGRVITLPRLHLDLTQS